MKPLWKILALFFYRRWASAEANKPVGVPGNRDPDAPCESYSPRARQWSDWHDCLTDGHYLCQKCCHRDPNPRDPYSTAGLHVYEAKTDLRAEVAT